MNELIALKSLERKCLLLDYVLRRNLACAVSRSMCLFTPLLMEKRLRC